MRASGCEMLSIILGVKIADGFKGLIKALIKVDRLNMTLLAEGPLIA